MTPRWLSLAAGLDAVSCRAMTGEFPPVTRMGGKRGVADHVLQLLGVWPQVWLMVDADPAIVEFWQAAFGGWLPAVAEIIRAAPCDGEELWKFWKDEPVPRHPLERVARWIVLQKGNFNLKPLSWGEKWEGVAGFSTESRSKHGNWATAVSVDKEKIASGAEAFWTGLAGYASLSDLAVEKGFTGRFTKDGTTKKLDGFTAGHGSAMLLDLATSSPVFRAEDLVTIDPPYRGTTGYGPDLTRERVVEIALEAHECGCRVLVHEVEPVITGSPWLAVELERRVGKNQRTWSKQRAEWATLNREPARTVHFSMAQTRRFAPIVGDLFP